MSPLEIEDESMLLSVGFPQSFGAFWDSNLLDKTVELDPVVIKSPRPELEAS